MNVLTAGTIRGTVSHNDGPLRFGGAEFPTIVDLADAAELFITTVSNTEEDPKPSSDLVLVGDLDRSGSVLRGTLEPPTPGPVSGSVSIVVIGDGAYF